MKIRQAEFKDTKDILALIKGKAEYDDCLDSLLATEECIADTFFSNRPKSWAIVAEVDSQLVGMARYDVTIQQNTHKKHKIKLDRFFC